MKGKKGISLEKEISIKIVNKNKPLYVFLPNSVLQYKIPLKDFPIQQLPFSEPSHLPFFYYKFPRLPLLLSNNTL